MLSFPSIIDEIITDYAWEAECVPMKFPSDLANNFDVVGSGIGDIVYVIERYRWPQHSRHGCLRKFLSAIDCVKGERLTVTVKCHSDHVAIDSQGRCYFVYNRQACRIDPTYRYLKTVILGEVDILPTPLLSLALREDEKKLRLEFFLNRYNYTYLNIGEGDTNKDPPGSVPYTITRRLYGGLAANNPTAMDNPKTLLQYIPELVDPRSPISMKHYAESFQYVSRDKKWYFLHEDCSTHWDHPERCWGIYPVNSASPIFTVKARGKSV